jgi:hypothetical protein
MYKTKDQVMLVHVQTLKQNSDAKDEFLFKLPLTWDVSGQVYTISKRSLCSAVQMLQQNEFTTILSDSKFSMVLSSKGANKFTVTCSTRNARYSTDCTAHHDLSPEFQGTSLQSLLRYLHNQMIPTHKECVIVSSKMQEVFGFISHNISDTAIIPKRVDDSFLLDNATSISKLTDMFNSNLHRSLSEKIISRRTMSNNSDAKVQTPVFSASYAALQLKLAAIFCATALQENCCMWHVSQNMMSDMSTEMQKSLYDSAPEKHYVTLLLKGDSIDERIFRVNIAVRFFPPSHPFASNLMPTAMAMNASSCQTGVLVLTGVRNNIAAAIYHNSDTKTVNHNKLALGAYMGMK